MIRLGLLVFALAACGAPAPRGPAWPTAQEPEKDGGESLAPRESAASVAAVEEEDEEEAEAEKPAEEVKPAEEAKPSPTPSVPAPSVEEPIFTEEIIIEIEE